jgi:hypothetical protein
MNTCEERNSPIEGPAFLRHVIYSVISVTAREHAGTPPCLSKAKCRVSMLVTEQSTWNSAWAMTSLGALRKPVCKTVWAGIFSEDSSPGSPFSLAHCKLSTTWINYSNFYFLRNLFNPFIFPNCKQRIVLVIKLKLCQHVCTFPCFLMRR